MDSTEQDRLDAEMLCDSLKLSQASQIEIRSWRYLTDSQRESRTRVAKDFAAKIRDPLMQRIRELEGRIKELEGRDWESGSQNQGSCSEGLVHKCYEAFNPGYPFSKTVDSFQDQFRKALNVAVAATEAKLRERINSHRCSFCLEQYADLSIVAEHIKTCPKHPLAAARKEIAELKNAIKTIVETRAKILICDETLDTAIKAAGSLITESGSKELDSRIRVLEKHLEHMEERYSMLIRQEVESMKLMINELKGRQ